MFVIPSDLVHRDGDGFYAVNSRVGLEVVPESVQVNDVVYNRDHKNVVGSFVLSVVYLSQDGTPFELYGDPLNLAGESMHGNEGVTLTIA